MELASAFRDSVTQALKELLEKKHLYQSASLQDMEPIVVATGGGDKHATALLRHRLKQDSEQLWLLGNTHKLESLARQPTSRGKILIRPPDLKLFCDECENPEAFNLEEAENVEAVPPPPGLIQVFVLSYRCQLCKGAPQVFLIRRDREKLTLCGRAPIEHVDVPKVIPKTMRDYYSKAIVAAQSGDTLAGNFRLRVLIEQWVKVYFRGNVTGKADEIVDAYMTTLPDDFKEHFTSLRELYGKLSDDIHAAIGNPELFESTQTALINHFDARRLFGLPDSVSPPTPDA